MASRSILSLFSFVSILSGSESIKILNLDENFLLQNHSNKELFLYSNHDHNPDMQMMSQNNDHKAEFDLIGLN